MSFPQYPKYKDSGVEWLGEVPEHWDVVPLKRRWDVRLGKMLQAQRSGTDEQQLPYLRAANIQWNGVDTTDVKEMWFTAHERRELELKWGDLLISEGGDVGRSCIWAEEIEHCAFQNSVTRVRSREGCSNRFLYYWMSTIKDKGYVDVLCNKSTIAHFTADKVAAVPVPLPPVSERATIESFLDRETTRIDELLFEHQRLIAILKEKREAVISHAVTKGLTADVPVKASGIEWLGDIPKHWDCALLSRIAERVVVGIAEAATHAYAMVGVPILRSTNIRAGAIIGDVLRIDPDFAGERNTKRLSAGDLVTVRTGNAGVTAIVPPELDGCQCFTMLITTLESSSSSEYYCYWMNSLPAQRYFSLEGWGTAQTNISVPILKALPVPIPPANEQAEIVMFLRREVGGIDALISQAEGAITLLRERRAALISAAVTGKIDVRHLADAEAA